MKNYFSIFLLLILAAKTVANQDDTSFKKSTELFGGEIGNPHTICYGDVPNLIIENSPASGGIGNFTYQWEKSIDEINFFVIIDSVGITFQPPDLYQTSYYRRKVTDESIPDALFAYSNTVTITVFDEFLAGTIGTSQTICYNAVPDELTEVNPTTGGSENYTYQWEQSVDGINFYEITGANSATYQPLALTETAYFKLKTVDNACASYVYSNTVTITVFEEVLGGKISFEKNNLIDSITVCYNAVPQIIANFSSPSGGNDIFTYQWEESLNTNDWILINDATKEQFQPANPAIEKKFYRRKATANYGGVAYSNIVVIDVDYVLTNLKTNLIDNNSIENGSRIVFNPNIETKHVIDLFSFTWEFIHEHTKLYETHYDISPAQYFHWEGWHTVILTVETENKCVFVETKEKLFYVNAEKPGESPKDLIFNDDIDNYEQESTIIIYPNPFINHLNINTNFENFVCEILMITGQKIIGQHLKKGSNNLNTSDIANGIYIIVVRNEKGKIIYREKIVKN